MIDEEEMKYESVTYGDSFMVVKRISEEEFLKYLIYRLDPEESKLVPCKMDLVDFGKVNKNKNKLNYGSSYAAVYIDEFKTENMPKPDTTTIEVIQSTDYERLNRIADYYSYSHYLIDSLVLDAMMEEKEEKNNDTVIGKISYRCSIPYNNGMYNTNHNENVPARRRRSRHC